MTEYITENVARVIAGNAFKPGCAYTLEQDEYEACLLQWEPGSSEPDVISIQTATESDEGYNSVFREEAPSWAPEIKPEKERKRYTAGYFMMANAICIALICSAVVIGIWISKTFY